MNPPELTPLIIKHFDELQFDLRLRHKASKLFVGHRAFESMWCNALYFTCGPAGETTQFVYDFFIKDADISWLNEYSAEDFEIFQQRAYA